MPLCMIVKKLVILMLLVQDVVLFKSGYETHVRQQERSVPPVPSWLESWDPMQDCKVKQVIAINSALPGHTDFYPLTSLLPLLTAVTAATFVCYLLLACFALVILAGCQRMTCCACSQHRTRFWICFLCYMHTPAPQWYSLMPLCSLSTMQG